MSDLTDIEMDLRQMTIMFEEVYEPNGNDVRDMVAIVSVGDDAIARVSIGRVESTTELRGALDRLAYYLGDTLPISD